MRFFSALSSVLGLQASQLQLSSSSDAKPTRFSALFLAACIFTIYAVSYAKNSIAAINSDQSVRLMADQNEAAWRIFNIETVENYIIPSYKNLADANSNLYLATQAFCKVLNSSSIAQLQENLTITKNAFHRSMDAWQLIQNVYFGPIEIGIRHHSIQFWPDKKNHIGKQLNKLIASKSGSSLTVDGFEKNSVSVKGLPAIERLLFNDAPLDKFKENPFSCQVLQGISRYLSDTASSLHVEWVTTMLPQFKDAKQLDGYFEDDIDAATALLKTLVEPIEVIRDLKLDRPLGSKFDKVKFKRLESWRSQRSLTNLQLNLQSLENFFIGADLERKGLRSLLTVNETAEIQNNFKIVESEITKIKVPLEEAILTDLGYRTAKNISVALTKLHKSLEDAIARSGIRLGFNSRDGD
mgnify:CR=1 FL=1